MALVEYELQDAIGAALVNALGDRDDWRHAHVSDLYGCDYSTRIRRTSKEKPKRNLDGPAALKMLIGQDVETRIADALAQVLMTRNPNCVVERNERIAWDPFSGAVRRGMLEPHHKFVTPHEIFEEALRGFDPHPKPIVERVTRECLGCDDCQPGANEIIGHADVTARLEEPVGNVIGETVYEVKSTSTFGYRKAINETRAFEGKYVEQTCGYAVPINARAACVCVVNRDSGDYEFIWLPLSELRAQTIARAQEMLEATDPEAFPPDPIPRYSWQPKYCDLGDDCACKAAADERA